MNADMPDWILNSHACYVLVAYAIALAAFVGLALVSWCAHRAATKEWQKLSQDRVDPFS